MKKTFLTCMAVVALLAIASGAGAITCTSDQRPAATLLIPYFQATFNQDGSVCSTGPCTASGASALDTLVTIGNASSAPMIAHVAVWSERTELVLDFNIALTGFDIQSFSVAAILHGALPVTPVNQQHVSEVKDGNQVTINGDVCQKNLSAPVYPAPGGYLRVRPISSANPLDNSNATVSYPSAPFPTSFLFEVLDSLDATKDSFQCGGTDANGVSGLTNPIHGYITIDHANYCTLANPNDPSYWADDAGGMENNLFGDYIFTSQAGVGTYGLPAVAIEADASLGDSSGAPTSLTPATGCSTVAQPGSANCVGRRTFYRRYVTQPENLFDATNTATPEINGCFNPFPLPQRAWDCGFGDQREPLGLKYAARYLDSGTLSSSFNVWRASAVPDSIVGGLQDLLGQPFGKCNTSEQTVVLTFFDEDENTTTFGCTFSPCGTPSTFNFPLETQRVPISNFSTAHPAGSAGWVSMEFFNSAGPAGGALDQAYVSYDFQGAGSFLSAGFPAAQLDPTSCQPLLVPVTPSTNGVTPTAPAVPLIVGTGP
jgi:hypothetical protein